MTNTASERATDEDIDRLRKSIKETNDDRKKDKLRRTINRAHDWRVQVWAQSEMKIRASNEQLAALGAEPVEPFEADFSTEEMLNHYSNMPLTK